MDPPKTPRTRSPSLTSLCFHPIPPEHPAHPRPSPKICWVRLCPDPSVRTEHKGETGVAAAPNTGDVPHLELLEMPHTTAGGSPSFQGRVRPGHLPPCPGNPSPPHPAAPIPPPYTPAPVGSAPPNTLKTNEKGEKKPAGLAPKLSQPQHVLLSTPRSQGELKKKSSQE